MKERGKESIIKNKTSREEKSDTDNTRRTYVMYTVVISTKSNR